MFTRAKADEIPVSVPMKNWYKNPMTIMGICMAGVFVLCIVLVVILVLRTRKRKRKYKVTESAANSRRSTSDCEVIENVNLEMEHSENVLGGIKTTETFEMKPMRHLDF